MWVVMREQSFGQAHALTPVDRFGVWLSSRRVRRAVGTFAGSHVGDFGCGYQAGFTRSVLGEVSSATLVDVAVAPDLVDHPNVWVIQGELPDALAKIPDASLDVILCLSVLEHVHQPEALLREIRRILRNPGVCVVNVPTWLGKRFLEFSAFRLGLSPAAEMDDHKRYYDPRDLWPLLVDAGFLPHQIRCHRHKFGLNTVAVCKTEAATS
jgi:SAM-dependent methyltransferase